MSNDAHLWPQYWAARDAGDAVAERRLAGEIVLSHNGWWYQRARKYLRNGATSAKVENLMTWYQLYALAAVPKYDPEQGTFLNFVHLDTRKAEEKFAGESYMFGTSSMATNARKVKSFLGKWYLTNNRNPTAEEIRQGCNLPTHRDDDTIAAIVRSITQPEDLMRDWEHPSVELNENAHRDQVREQVLRVLAEETFTPREWDILTRHMIHAEDMTVIAKEYGISRQAIAQSKAKLVKRLADTRLRELYEQIS